MVRPGCRRIVVSFAVLAASVWIGSGQASAQESYRTQHSLEVVPSPLRKTQTDSPGSARPVRPLRFLGWRQAIQQGPNAVRYFQSLLNASASSRFSELKGASGPVANASFSPAQLGGILLRPSLPTGALPTGVAVGDFNGDGKLDWAVANGGDDSLCIYLGNGDGTSQPGTIIDLYGQSPVGIAAGDLNGDGKVDLAVVESDSDTVGILFGNGDGTFQPEIEMPVFYANPLGIAIADLNNDGKPDLIVGLQGGGPITNLDFEVLLNEGGGNFSAPIYAPPLISDGADEGFGFSVGDINGDGIPDLLVTGADAFSTTVKTYFGKGDGSFTAGSLVWSGNPGTGSDVGAAVLADVNGDHCLDMTDAMDSGVVVVFYNDCHGNFPAAPSVTYGVADGAVSLAVADVNGDGFPDIITGSIPNPNQGGGYGYSPGNSLTVRFNNGTGNFGPARVYVGDPGMVALALADLKGDGHPDVVTANELTNTTTVYGNDGSGDYGEPAGGYDGFIEGIPTSPVNAPVTGYAMADVDGDGKPDLVLVEHTELGSYDNTEPLTVLLNQGNGQFSLPIRSVVNATGAVLDFVMADFRKVGRPDFLALTIDQSSGPSPQLIYAQNIGGGQFGLPVTISLPYSYLYAFGTLAVGDFNNDGKLDFAVCAPQGSTEASSPVSDALTVYLGNGDGTFSASPFQLSFANGADCQAMFVGDANGDSKPDLFMWLGTNEGSGGLGLYEALGQGNGTFAPPTEVFSSLSKMTMADLNHDGRLDIVDIEPGASTAQVNIYLGQANGTFSGPVTYSPYTGMFAVSPGSGEPDNLIQSFGPYVGDFNGDGNLDVAVFQFLSESSPNVFAQILLGNGDGTFTPSYDTFRLDVPLVPDLAAYNLLGDGKTALVQSGGFTSSFQVLPSTQAPFVQTQMAAIPVIGGEDALNISIDVPSSSDTTVTLAASNPNVSISPSVTIPAGQLSVEAPFSLAPTMPTNQWFSITAESNGATSVAYNFSPAAGSIPSFLLNVYAQSATRGPGESSPWLANLSSTGVGTGTFQVSCSGLPTGASCANFSPASVAVGPGMTAGTLFTINTDSTIQPGTYAFTVVASDGFTSVTGAATLTVGDFSLALQPASVSAAPAGAANFTLNVGSQFGFSEAVTLGCLNLPTGASCVSAGQTAQYGQQPFVINLNQVAAGTYNFTVTGTSVATTHSTTGQVQVASEAIAGINLSPLSFGTVIVNVTSPSQPVSLTNNGNIALNLTNIVAGANAGSNGSFGQTNNCGASLSPSNSCTINVSFTPSAVGNSTGTLTVTDNAPSSPQVISLSGSAADFSFGPAAGASTSATISAGQTAVYDLQVQGNELSATVGLACSNAPSEAFCSAPANIQVSGASAIPFQVLVSTTARSGVVLPGRFRFELLSPLKISAMGIMLVLIAASLALRSRRLRDCVLLFAIVGMLAVVASCGGGGGGNNGGGGGGGGGTPAGTYTITITGQCENATRSINLTLTVQ